MREDVLIIGAGPAGISCAYTLQKAGISYRVVDSGKVIASTWSNLYPSLRLNTTRFFSHLPGKKFPLHYGMFPSGKQYHRYLVEYCQENQLNIHLGVTVHRITPDQGGWCVETSEGMGWYPVIINATGRFGSPYIPEIPGLSDFKGTVIHAHQYKGAEAFKNQSVLVVGNGPSGVDISIEIGKQNTPRHPALLSMRTGILLRPRYPLGLPKHLWMMLFDRLPEKISTWLSKKVENIRYRNLEKIGIKAVDSGTSGAASTRGPELIHAVKAGQVVCVDGPKQFYENEVELDNGACLQIDSVILATGYRPGMKYLEDLDLKSNGDGWPERYSSLDYQNITGLTYGVGRDVDEKLKLFCREVKDYPGLFLVGQFYQGKGAMYNFKIEAEAATHQIKQYLAHRESEAKERWTKYTADYQQRV